MLRAFLRTYGALPQVIQNRSRPIHPSRTPRSQRPKATLRRQMCSVQMLPDAHGHSERSV
jgi:hypothetical protein